ncbi:MAG TPA: hypothetical protein VF251_09150 [Pyrinomonadaceae bacterium]
MKYFTKELWLGGNSRSESDQRKTLEQWNANLQEYQKQLKALQSRLTKRDYNFFTKLSLHDGRVTAFTVGDAIHHDIQGPEKFDINVHNPSVEIKVLGWQLDMQYTLKYRKVRKVLFDYPTDKPLFHHEGGHIGDWGYDELTAADENFLRHEVLFASGTTILIEFQQFSYEQEKCEGSRYQCL